MTTAEIRRLMLNWFRSKYEDPANNMPYGDGEYTYIWGGPFDAREVLTERYEGKVSASLIESVILELEEDCTEWAPAEEPPGWADD